ncbi:MAG: electron transport complex subunit RsxC [Spirochaetaceae bacterium]|jgi:electron transport complex protein RnfC|nr:electron transport complex subunit RsxC [Spirochaetaceae bacterium]
MKTMATFKGGIHPPGKKDLTVSGSIETAALPNKAIIPLVQHIGAPAECLVKPGDIIEEEQLIGQAQGFISANIHSPIPGKVIEITQVYLGHGPLADAVVIELEGSFKRLGNASEPKNWKEIPNDEILNKIKSSGIVGLGGATFPSHVKFSLPPGKVCENFIINAVECESYLNSDNFMMLEHPDEILQGIEIISTLIKPKKVIIGIEANKLKAAKLLKKRIAELNLDIQIALLKVKYPQGAEKNLIKAIIGKEVPSGKLPLEIGVINTNVSTCFAVYEAVALDKPLVERIVTMSGEALRNPKVLKVRIGTPISELIEECGGFKEKPFKVVSGGPMMGTSFFDLNTPVIKSTSGILFLTEKEINQDKMDSCVSCGKCITACPMGLNPTTIYKALDFELLPEALNTGLMDCVECGSCSYVCPSNIPLVSLFKVGRNEARKK